MTDKINDGGPAFPLIETPDLENSVSPGMSLRDYFAAKAMAAIICMPDGSADGDYDEGSVASHAYLMADAMLKAREVKHD